MSSFHAVIAHNQENSPDYYMEAVKSRQDEKAATVNRICNGIGTSTEFVILHYSEEYP
jgi:hypothetical protein